MHTAHFLAATHRQVPHHQSTAPTPTIMRPWLQVKALEAAEAARRKEAQKATERAAQRQQVEAQKAERAKRAQDAKVGTRPDQCLDHGRSMAPGAAE